MNGTPNSSTHEKRDLLFILNEIIDRGNFTGIIFANRNGEILNEIIKKNIDSKQFTSMCASVIESAVGLGETMGNQQIVKIIGELEEHTVLFFQIKNKDAFLIFLLNNQTDSTFISEYLEEYIKEISTLS